MRKSTEQSSEGKRSLLSRALFFRIPLPGRLPSHARVTAFAELACGPLMFVLGIGWLIAAGIVGVQEAKISAEFHVPWFWCLPVVIFGVGGIVSLVVGSRYTRKFWTPHRRRRC